MRRAVDPLVGDFRDPAAQFGVEIGEVRPVRGPAGRRENSAARYFTPDSICLSSVAGKAGKAAA